MYILIKPEDIFLLRKMWTIWFIQRISKIIRQISNLKFDNFLSPIENLPLKIKKREVLIAYITHKLKMSKEKKTRLRLDKKGGGTSLSLSPPLTRSAG